MNGTGQFDPLHFGTTLSEADIEISDEMYLLTAQDAEKYIEPPTLTLIEVSPTSVRCHPAESVRFMAKGFDQHGGPFPLDSPVWLAETGHIDVTGQFTATDSPGSCTIRAKSGAIEATAIVTIVGKDDIPPPPPEPVAGMSWRGEIPTQKWMNFYTKVLTRFAGSPGLCVKVEFEVPASPNLTDAKRQETRIALRELGLDERLSGD
jgi:hypothetical protein